MSSVGQGERMSPEQIEAVVSQEEQATILEAFGDFKDVVGRNGDAEMRVTLARDKRGRPEIVYVCFYIKRSLERMRNVYRLRKEGGFTRRFGEESPSSSS